MKTTANAATETAAREAAIEVNDVTHVYVNTKGAYPALAGIDLRIKTGEFVSLIGPSGCGKTTILSLISGLLSPVQGEVRVMGEPVTKPTPQVGYMLQQDYLFPWRTIEDNVMLGLELLDRKNDESVRSVRQLLEEMGLGAFRHATPQQLSGGMRQRAALVRTLAAEPGILLLDEPFSALDYQTKLQLEDLIVSTLKAKGKTAVLVTHDISEAIAMSDRIIVLQPRPGRLLAEVEVPEPIRSALPLEAREKAGFHELFRSLWQMFEQMERKEEGHDDA
ncbi:NitT/TauT family transport system ATP-binding protein [Paenibacillus sp. UNCCL117]|uniref:ABC transporter ATP-binding protein n=1 Tax=unclassified Paenibacillus TaxID=185978 RepID=UPI000881CB62|nr:MULTISPECIES: ABC transporter ATP-binding protein [unclassified Paenibacillus]SDC45345.1 NitT/TauT family transport system ATP-binding protein [Paenibacillus sp. cl123]SFW12529.1 NitT/TauT family transport system ATP-binding protein [Paenibacillus sp. UNCCL117]